MLRADKVLDFAGHRAAGGKRLGVPGMPPHMRLPFAAGIHGRHADGSVAGMELAALTPQLGAYFGTDKGVLVLRAPHQAGFDLHDGDVIFSIDGREPTSGSHATRILRSYRPGREDQTCGSCASKKE